MMKILHGKNEYLRYRSTLMKLMLGEIQLHEVDKDTLEYMISYPNDMVCDEFSGHWYPRYNPEIAKAAEEEFSEKLLLEGA